MSGIDKKIMILYAKFGDGHYQAAKALQHRFMLEGIRNVELFDPFGVSYPFLNRLSQKMYYGSTSSLPTVYGWGYKLTDKIQSSSPIGRWLHSLGSNALTNRLRESLPDAVIQTFPLLTMSHLREQSGYRLPTFTVLTDYVLHSRWVHEDTDGYFVATDELKRSLDESGIPAYKITVSGIPIRSRFKPVDPTLESRQIKESYLKSMDRQVLVMAGAYGVSSQVGLIVDALLTAPDIGVTLVCGRKEKLKRQMESKYAGHDRVRIYAYVEAIEKLMAEASCLITKAGGITLTEAAAMNLPVVVYRPIPGQEEGNALYWARQGRLRTARNSRELLQYTVELLDRSQADEPAEPQASPIDAAGRIVENVLAYLGTESLPERARLIPRRKHWLRLRSRSPGTP